MNEYRALYIIYILHFFDATIHEQHLTNITFFKYNK